MIRHFHQSNIHLKLRVELIYIHRIEQDLLISKLEKSNIVLIYLVILFNLNVYC